MPLLHHAWRLLGGFRARRLDVSRRYERLREAVHGTMSEFFVVRDRKTGQICGLKILDPEKTAAFENRFPGLNKPSEADIFAQLHHPRIVRFMEKGVTRDGRHYILMQYVEGRGLNTLIHEKAPELDGRRLDLLAQMLEAIAAVHAAGFIHRDICPRNFQVSPDLSRITLMDFGLTVPNRPEFLGPGNRTGTPSFMAPEIVRRRDTDHRVDLFAFGASAYQLCSFSLPWPTPHQANGRTALAHDRKPPRPLTELAPHLHPQLVGIIMKCLAPQPEDRPPTAEAIRRAIEAVPSETV